MLLIVGTVRLPAENMEAARPFGHPQTPAARLQFDRTALGRSRIDDPDADHRLLHGHPVRAAAVRGGAREPRLSLVLLSWAGGRCARPLEMLFAHLKRIFRMDRLRLRGPDGGRDEFHLAATAQKPPQDGQADPHARHPSPRISGVEACPPGLNSHQRQSQRGVYQHNRVWSGRWSFGVPLEYH